MAVSKGQGAVLVGASPLESVPERRRTPALVRFARRKPLGAVSLAVVALMLLAAASANIIAPFEPNAQHYTDLLKSPNPTYWMGTDGLGRDIGRRLFRGELLPDAVDDLAHVGIGRLAPRKPRGEARARVGKEDVVHERDRRGRALDVEQHDADAGGAQPHAHGREGVAGATYAGPKQSGWKPRSMPLSV